MSTLGEKMTHKHFAIFGSLILIAFILGCTGGGETVANETKLEVTEGVGIVGSLKIDSLNPGLDGYISLTVRSNLGGEPANNVTVSLDNVSPFQIFECGGYQFPNTLRNCTGQFDLDNGISFRSHKTSRLAPGEEIDVFWRIEAPDNNTISNIALKHPIYYDVEYTYRTGFHQNIIFMSQQEQFRRKQAEEDYQISGESGMGAGELRISSTTQQPMIFFFNEPSGTSEKANFSFPLQFSVENKGTGMPLSDVVVLFEYPISQITGQAPILPEATAHTYGWYTWETWDGILVVNGVKRQCNDGNTSINCKTWITKTFGDDFDSIGGTNKNDKGRLLVKVVAREDFIDSFNLFVPLQLTATELNNLKNTNAPLKIYTFRLFTMYTYFIEGKDYINVYPIKIKG